MDILESALKKYQVEDKGEIGQMAKV
jgi:hypothetical protein